MKNMELFGGRGAARPVRASRASMPTLFWELLRLTVVNVCLGVLVKSFPCFFLSWSLEAALQENI
jgi:hypothetical protein